MAHIYIHTCFIISATGTDYEFINILQVLARSVH